MLTTKNHLAYSNYFSHFIDTPQIANKYNISLPQILFSSDKEVKVSLFSLNDSRYRINDVTLNNRLKRDAKRLSSNLSFNNNQAIQLADFALVNERPMIYIPDSAPEPVNSNEDKNSPAQEISLQNTRPFLDLEQLKYQVKEALVLDFTEEPKRDKNINSSFRFISGNEYSALGRALPLKHENSDDITNTDTQNHAIKEESKDNSLEIRHYKARANPAVTVSITKDNKEALIRDQGGNDNIAVQLNREDPSEEEHNIDSINRDSLQESSPTESTTDASYTEEEVKNSVAGDNNVIVQVNKSDTLAEETTASPLKTQELVPVLREPEEIILEPTVYEEKEIIAPENINKRQSFLRLPIPMQVTKIYITKGQQVTKDQIVLVATNSLKWEETVRADYDAIITDVYVGKDDIVLVGQVLFEYVVSDLK